MAHRPCEIPEKLEAVAHVVAGTYHGYLLDGVPVLPGVNNEPIVEQKAADSPIPHMPALPQRRGTVRPSTARSVQPGVSAYYSPDARTKIPGFEKQIWAIWCVLFLASDYWHVLQSGKEPLVQKKIRLSPTGRQGSRQYDLVDEQFVYASYIRWMRPIGFVLTFVSWTITMVLFRSPTIGAAENATDG